MSDAKSTLKAKIEAKRLERTNKTIKLQKIEKLKEQANKDIKSQLGEQYDVNNLMNSFMKNVN